jgi:hypothetical protein
MEFIDMNRTLISLFVMGSLILFVLSPFSALAMLMLVLFAGAVIGFVLTIVQAVIRYEPKATSQRPEELGLSEPTELNSP